MITDRSNEADGWLTGEFRGVKGVFPATHVEPVKAKYVPPPPVASRQAPPVPTSQSAPAPAPVQQKTMMPPLPPAMNVIATPMVPMHEIKARQGAPPPPSSATVSTSSSSVGVATEVAPRSVVPAPVVQAKPADPVGAGSVTRKRQSLFCLYAHYSALLSGSFYAITGLILLVWGLWGFSPSFIKDNPVVYTPLDVGVGFWALGTGFAIVLYEVRYGESRAGLNHIPFRGILYTLATIPGFFALPTGIGGGTLLISALANFISTAKGEFYRPPLPPAPKKKSKESDDLYEKAGFCGQILILLGGTNPDRQLSRIIFFAIYLIGSLYAGISHSIKAIRAVNDAIEFNRQNHLNPQIPVIPDMEYHTYWIGGAKFFGNLLNFNYTIILIPVSHSLMRWMVDKSRGRNFFSTLLRGILWIFPVDDALRIHKLCGYAGFIAAIGHMVCHLINYVQKAEFVWTTFGIGIWITGIILTLCIFALYPATRPDLKRGHFEIFWATHMLYLVLFVTTFIHGKGLLGPNYWKWLIIPGSIYIFERIWREIVIRKPVSVISATFMSNSVLSLVVAKDGPLKDYSEGQYAYISCPTLSGFQWHPFTISSAPQEDFVSFHIRVQDKGSWTYKLRDFFRVLGAGSNRACLKLAHIEEGKTIPGLVEGPNGTPLIRIHGPYSAPTQHFSEYNDVMVCASGIGVTPLASALKSIVHFRWRFAVDRAFPDVARFIWVAAHREIPSFRWLVRTIKEAEDALADLRQKGRSVEMATRKLKIQIFITSYSKAETEKFLRQNQDEVGVEDAGLWGLSYGTDDPNAQPKAKCSYSEMDLYTALMSPTEGTREMGNVQITLGRPKWDEIFSEVHSTTREKSVGVTFCGNPLIGKDIKHHCLKYTIQDGGRTKYHLHKEVF